MPMKELVEKRNQLAAKQAELAKIFEEAGEDMDLTKVKCIEGNTQAKVEKIRSLNDELNDLGKEVENLADVEKAAIASKKAQESRSNGDNRASGIIHPESKDGDPPQRKTFSQLVAEDEGFKRWIKSGHGGTFGMNFDVFPSDLGRPQIKTLFETGAGWAPESTRTGIVVDYATRPIQLIDLIPSGRTVNAAVKYMEETTFTNSAAEKAEGAAYAESAFELTERSQTVEKITNSLPVTDEQLEDVEMVASYLDNRLRFGARQRLDYQILQGDGSTPNLQGLLYTGLQTQAKGVDPVPDAIHKAITKVRVTGRANPNAVVMHPNDWEGVRLLRTADGIYIWGSPAEAVAPRIWGLPVAVSDVATENTGLVGDFANFSMLFERRGIEVQIGYVNDDFTKGKKTMRADMRVALVRFRAYAFCSVTGI